MYLFVSTMPSVCLEHCVNVTFQGGRLVTERRMVSDIYEFDMHTFNWEKITPFPEDDTPDARYFHSADACEYAQRT